MTTTQLKLKTLLETKFAGLIADGTLPADLWRLDPPDALLWVETALSGVDERLASNDKLKARLESELRERRKAT